MGLNGWGHSQAQCDSSEPWTVANASGAYALSQALENCPDGTFVVDWSGHVTVEASINITAGTSLTITGGEDLDAVVDGGGSTRLFYVDNAALNLTNVTLVNGRAYRGGAIYAREGSKVRLNGTTVLAYNYARYGGAISVEDSSLSWDGKITFANNTAFDFMNSDSDGGALHLHSTTLHSSGTTVFVNNSAGAEGGVARIDLDATA